MRARNVLSVTKDYGRRVCNGIPSARIITALGYPFYRLLGENSVQVNMNLSQVKRVLVVRLDEIGDVVMTTPFLRELRRLLPDAWITLVVKPSVYNLVELCPYVNEVLTYDWRGARLCQPLQRHWRALRLAWKHLWQGRFDLAILPRWDTDGYHGTYLLYFSGARWRIGYSENVTAAKKRDNMGFDRMLTHVLEDNTLKHDVEHNLDVIRFLGGHVQDQRLELWVDDQDKNFADEVLGCSEVEPGDLLVALCPGAGARKRQWPIHKYAEICLWLRSKYQARLLIVGGPGEEPLGRELQSKFGSSAINVVGKTTLRHATAMLKRASLYVGSDAGAMHIAAAVGTPVVELSCHPETGSPYGSNSPSRFGPWCANRKIIQPRDPGLGCSEECVADVPHCILGISVDRVKEAVYELLEARSIATGSRGPVGRNLGSPGGIPE